MNGPAQPGVSAENGAAEAASVWSKLAQLSPYMRHRRGSLAAIVALTIATSATGILQPWPMKILIDYAFGEAAVPLWLGDWLAGAPLPPSPWLFIALAAALTLAIFVINSLLDIGLSYLWMSTGQGSVYDLSHDMYSKMIHLSPACHAGSFIGDQLERLSTDAYCVYTMLSKLLVSPLQRLLTIAGIAVISWSVDPWLTLCSFGVTPILAANVFYFGPILRSRARARREAQSRLTQFVHQTFTAIPLVQAYDSSRRNDQIFGRLADEAVTASQRGVLAQRSLGLVNGGANSVGQALVLVVGSQRVLSGDLTIGSLLLFIAYVRTLQQNWRILLETFTVMKTAEASLDRALQSLQCQDPVSVAIRPVALPRRDAGMRVSLEHVEFAYDAGYRVLHDLHLELSPGERVALVGPSGGGKSTLFQLLLRFYDPTSGVIRVDGIDLRDLDLEELRGQVAYLPQEPFILPLTIRENLLYGRPDASHAELEEAARAADLMEMVERLPDGWDTQVGQRGSALSGGQKQRLAMARCFLKRSRLLLLDEPTSALDACSEASVVQAIHATTAGLTTITIAHRLSTVANCDRILVIDQGRIVQDGNPADLLQTDGLYRTLVEANSFDSTPQEVAR